MCLCCVWFSVAFVWVCRGDLFAVIGGLGDLLFGGRLLGCIVAVASCCVGLVLGLFWIVMV